MSAVCAFCGRPSDHEHHVTGRGHDRSYIDPDFTVPLCHDDHSLVHEDLRESGIDDPAAATTIVERVEYWLRRLGSFLSRLAQVWVVFCWLEALARAVIRRADDLRHHCEALDAWDTRWRTIGDV